MVALEGDPREHTHNKVAWAHLDIPLGQLEDVVELFGFLACFR